jgi:nucleoid-associated protein YgaU
LPGFDVVRVSPEGDAVIAGQAEPGSEIQIRVDEVQAASAMADAQGKFVALFTLAPSALPRILTLQSVLADGRRLASADSVVLAPTPEPPPVALADAADPTTGAADPVVDAADPAMDAADPAVDVADPTTGVADLAMDAADPALDAADPVVDAADPAMDAADPAVDVADPAAQTKTAQAAAAPAEASTAEAVAAADPVAAAPAPAAADVAPAVPAPAPQAALLLSEGGARVLQAAGGEDIDPRNVTIDAISYSTKGDVQLSGRGQSEGFVRLYLDNEPLMDTEIAPDGTWDGTLPAVAAGQYLLRADQLDAQGEVLSRYETPFQRESPEVLAAAAPGGADAPMAAKITVQPGFTLWGIARQNYGSGVMYVQVYEANKQMIGDPDLIYPGQVFNVPVRTPSP